MASIERRENDDGTVRWRVKWREEGRQFSETFGTRTEATRFRGNLDRNGNRRARPKPRLADIPTVGDWCERAIAARSGIEARTRADYQALLDNHLGELADLYLDELTREDIGVWVTGLQLKPKTIANVHGVLSACLTDAARDGLIARNPAEGVKLPRKDGPDAHEMIVLTAEQVRTIVAQTPSHWRPLVQALAGTGMRWSEATALPVKAVDLGAGTIRIQQSWKRQPDYTSTLGAPKTRRGNRSIGITSTLTETLRPLVESRGADELVFLSNVGKRIDPESFRRHVWNPALERADLKARIHDLRHSHASWLIEAGVPIVKIQRRLGHESIQTTVDTYGHLMPDSEDEVISALEELE